MKPDGPVIEKARFGEPCGQCIFEKDYTSYESFAATLIRRLIERIGIKPRYPTPTIGKHVDPDDDAKFLHIPPPDRAGTAATKLWVGRLIDILGGSISAQPSWTGSYRHTTHYLTMTGE